MIVLPGGARRCRSPPRLDSRSSSTTRGSTPSHPTARVGLHRVVAAPGYEGERSSVVQFCHPRPWTVLAPVPSCCTPDHPQRFSAISAADALDEVLYQINLVEDARRV